MTLGQPDQIQVWQGRPWRKGQQKHFLTPALEGKLGPSVDDEGVTSPETMQSVLLRIGWGRGGGGGEGEAERKKEAGVMGQ